MSILSEYEDIKRQLGEDKWNAIDKYIDTKRPDLRLDEIVYEPENWMEFEKWFYNQKNYLLMLVTIGKMKIASMMSIEQLLK